MADSDQLFIGINGRVVCLRRRSGRELWRTKLKRGSNITTLVVENDTVYAASSGYLHALERHNGRVKWTNDLKKLGFGVIILGSSMQSAVAGAQAAQAAQVASIAAIAATAGVIAATSGAS